MVVNKVLRSAFVVGFPMKKLHEISSQNIIPCWLDSEVNPLTSLKGLTTFIVVVIGLLNAIV